MTASFNLDAKLRIPLSNPQQDNDDRESYFGYTVALHSSGNSAWAFIGAPRANGSSNPDVTEEGALYRCRLWGNQNVGLCERVPVGTKGIDGQQGYRELKSFNWLGGSLDVSSDGPDPVITTCSSRWRYELTYDARYFMNGACYWTSLDDLTSPDLNSDTWRKVYSLLDYGTVATLKPKDDFGIIESRRREVTRQGSSWVITTSEVMEPLAQSQDYDYYGYSVTSGRFWGQHDSYVSSAPRADLYGKVYVVGSESGRVEWLTTGTQVGAGFGMVVAAGDVTGDGVDELFVGAPLYVRSEVWEAGTVFAYTVENFGELSLSARLEGGVRDWVETGGGRFGSALTVIGDLDRDGFNDLAVGAPYEDGGGVVYIYRGSETGLVVAPSQTISASDMGSALRGFGSAISRGTDVDGNGYIDVAIGAHEGRGGVMVVRSRKVLHLHMHLETDQNMLTEVGAVFTLDACGRYWGHALQDNLGLVYEGRIDGGQSFPRATFLSTGSGQVKSEVTGKKGQQVCRNYQVKLKENIADFQTPLQVTFHCGRQVEDTGTMEAPDSTPSSTLRLPLVLGCGGDGVCSPSLETNAFWSDGSDMTYTVGSGVPLKLIVRVKVREEPAYLGRVRIVLPSGLAPSYPPYSCDVVGGSELDCMLTSPLLPDSEEEVEVVLVEMAGGVLEEGEVEVEVRVEATGANTQITYKKVRIVKDVHLILRGYTEADYVYYNPNLTTPDVTAKVTLQAENRGVSPATETLLEATFPISFSTAEGGRERIAEVEVASGSDTLNCIYESSGSISDELDDSHSNPTPPTEAAHSVWCGLEGVTCGRVKCHLGEVKQATTVGLMFTYHMAPIIARYGRNVTAGSHLTAVLTTPDAPETWTGVWTIMVPLGYSPPLPPAPPVPAWVWVVGVGVGILVLAGVVGGLWKIGFFKRRKPGMEEREGDVETNKTEEEQRNGEGEEEREEEQQETEEDEERAEREILLLDGGNKDDDDDDDDDDGCEVKEER
ncbi:hypothetical protein Pcinc_024566 [Petrolisthes cinctipes]|uniref:Integrin alpha first immunoglubulin-like domain-containing protein n=1 Tax=Petrolisthes cinctipes TaxID=88211 RepID=A0AAE1F9N2_PETCI|nr:hypothetical protein Pcinc_024566 [Petrolisthes cinctipes]